MKKNISNSEIEKSPISKQIQVILINLMLSLVSVYLLAYWWRVITDLDTMQMSKNIGIVVLLVATFFVGKTYYTKGVINNIKKIIIVTVMTAGVIALFLWSLKVPEDMVYPFSGIIIVSIGFYMLSLSSGTLGMAGMTILSLLTLTPIATLMWFNKIELDTALTLTQVAVVIILFFGGTWAYIRGFMHAIRGVNNDGGFGDTNDGDAGDGDGDTGDE